MCCDTIWTNIDVLLTPAADSLYRIEGMLNDPIPCRPTWVTSVVLHACRPV